MKHKIIIHIFLCILLNNTIIASENTSLAITETTHNLSAKTDSSQPSSPRQSHLSISIPTQSRSNSSSPLSQSPQKKEILKFSESKIEKLFAKLPLNKKYYLVGADGLLDEDSTMDLNTIDVHYKGEIILENDQYFVQASRLLDNEKGYEPLDKKDQFLMKTNITKEQIQTLLYNHLITPFNNTEIFALNSNNNLYCIPYKNFPAEDLDAVESKITQEKLRAYNPIALIADNKGIQYICRIVSRQKTQMIEIHKQKHPFSNAIADITTGITIIPTNNNQYNKVLQITDNQWVVINNSHQLYILNTDNDTLFLQSSTDTDRASFIRLQEIFPNKPIIIVPLPTKSADNKSPEQLTPDISKDTNRVTYALTTSIIGGGLTCAVILAILYYNYDKLPNLKELFNNISHRIQNISFTQ